MQVFFHADDFDEPNMKKRLSEGLMAMSGDKRSPSAKVEKMNRRYRSGACRRSVPMRSDPPVDRVRALV